MLAGTIIADKPPNRGATKGILKKAWSGFGEAKIVEVKDKIFAITVSDATIAKMILDTGPCFVTATMRTQSEQFFGEWIGTGPAPSLDTLFTAPPQPRGHRRAPGRRYSDPVAGVDHILGLGFGGTAGSDIPALTAEQEESLHLSSVPSLGTSATAILSEEHSLVLGMGHSPMEFGNQPMLLGTLIHDSNMMDTTISLKPSSGRTFLSRAHVLPSDTDSSENLYRTPAAFLSSGPLVTHTGHHLLGLGNRWAPAWALFWETIWLMWTSHLGLILSFLGQPLSALWELDSKGLIVILCMVGHARPAANDVWQNVLLLCFLLTSLQLSDACMLLLLGTTCQPKNILGAKLVQLQ
ncbi:hypothetical protein ACE6H2_026243 [Prunus campanulata]